MRRIDIERMFTEIVSKYIAMGYTLHTESMRGSQGEVSKVNLRKGEELIGIVLNRYYKSWNRGFEIKVGRYKNPDNYSLDRLETAWLNYFDYFETHKFVCMNDDYYCDKEWFINEEDFKSEEYRKKQYERSLRKYEKPRTLIENEKMIKYVLPKVKTFKGFKTCKASDIRIEKVTWGDTHHNGYRVSARGKVVYSI